MSNREYWREKLKANIERDRAIVERLEAHGWRALRLWIHETPDVLADKIAAFVLQTEPSDTA